MNAPIKPPRTPLHEEARRRALEGQFPFPCRVGRKDPACPNGFRDGTNDLEQIDRWWSQADYNLAVSPGRINMFVLDQDGPAGSETLASLELEHGFLPETLVVRTASGPSNLHYWFMGRIPSTVAKLGPKLDTRSYGGYVLVPPSVVNGVQYEIERDVEIAEGPGWISKALARSRESHTAADVALDLSINVERARAYLQSADPVVKGQGADARAYEVAAAVLNLGLSPDKAIEVICEEWAPDCQPSIDEQPDYVRAFIERKVRNAAEYAQNEPGAWAVAPCSETFAHIAAAQSLASVPTDSDVSSAPPAEMMAGSPISDIALSNYFADCHGHHLRYDEDQNRWYAFKSGRWIEAKQFRIWNLIKPHHIELVRYCHGLKPAERKSVCSKATVAAVEALSRGHDKLVISTAEWDADPMMLNTPDEIVDLRTGRSRPAAAEDYCTKSTSVAPDFTMDCPLWRKFLTDITAGDKELQAFIQRKVGYCLTGLTTEHAMFFAYGTGGNGKGVLLNTIARILADYAVAAPVDTFTQSSGDRHPTDLAMLRGARLVTAQETEQGRRWAEAKVKMLTGGDPVRARFMHQDFFEYTPQFKLVIAGNHKPRLENVDEAIRRRLHLVPFTVTIPEAERDPDLPTKLMDEWPGILAWAIEGCLEWQRVGLLAPPAVTEATQEYFATQDPLADWLGERCIRDPNAWTASAELYADYCTFTRLPPQERDSRIRFGERLESQRFKPRRQGPNRARGFAGIALTNMPTPDGDEVPV